MLYVVIIAVENSRREEWVRWMRDEHIGHVLDTGCFNDATFVRDKDADTPTHSGYRILYRASDMQAFERYQREFGPALRDDHVRRFGGCTTARRELLPVVE